MGLFSDVLSTKTPAPSSPSTGRGRLFDDVRGEVKRVVQDVADWRPPDIIGDLARAYGDIESSIRGGGARLGTTAASLV